MCYPIALSNDINKRGTLHPANSQSMRSREYILSFPLPKLPFRQLAEKGWGWGF